MMKENIDIKIKNIPELDKEFIPLEAYNREFLKTAKFPFSIALEQSKDQIAVVDTFVHGTKEMISFDFLYIERLIKFLLWAKGGHTILLCGDSKIVGYIKETYCLNGKRSFDYLFMSRVYEKELKIIEVSKDAMPQTKNSPKKIEKHLNGCRIGLDLGGSDRKVSAVVNGQTIYSEEVEWYPKAHEDPEYHYLEIVKALKTAAGKMDRVDAIGISAAGIYRENKTRIASLFIKVPQDIYEEKVKDIFIRAVNEIGDIPFRVINDGDVTALAGAMSLNDGKILGIAMGTSEAVGYVDSDQNIMGWLNELAFAPVDLQGMATKDEWSLDYGVGCKYFSQDAIIKLAPAAGISLEDSLSLAEKLKAVQGLMEDNDERAAAIYRTIGCYIGHTIPLYDRFYDMKHVLLMGRVTSGKGGNLMIEMANKVIKEEYPEIESKINLQLPDEKSRRVGQSIAAASLPIIGRK